MKFWRTKIGGAWLATVALSASQIASAEGFTAIDMFFVGGQMQSGEYQGQALIHALKTAKEDSVPVIFYPGLGLSSYIWLATPDGREGWAQLFARELGESYVFDPVETGPSGMSVRPIRDGSVTADRFNEWEPDAVWPFFGFGAEPGQPYNGAQFPVESIDQLHASYSLRLGGLGRASGSVPGSGVGSANYDALLALLEKTGPSVLVGHSFAGRTLYPLGREHPELVKAIVAIETDGCPTQAEDIGGLADIPYLTLYGDYLDLRAQEGRMAACQTTVDLINATGGRASLWYLPEQGLSGNSHNMMQDRNSAVLADRVLDWLQEVSP